MPVVPAKPAFLFLRQLPYVMSVPSPMPCPVEKGPDQILYSGSTAYRSMDFSEILQDFPILVISGVLEMFHFGPQT